MPAPLYSVPKKWKETVELDKTAESRKSQKKKPTKEMERADKTLSSKKTREKPEVKTRKESRRSKKGQKAKMREKSEKMEEIQNRSKPLRPVKYKTSQMEQQVQRMMAKNESRSLLQAAAHVIRFRQTAAMETCYHLDVFNPTTDNILFQVESPPVGYLSAKPKIGHLGPGEGCTLFLLFSFRCPRLPDDLSFVYTIRQSRIMANLSKELAQDKEEYTTRQARRLAKQAGRFMYRWHVAVAFYDGEGELYSCPGPHFEGTRPQLDLQGQIFEDSYNPDDRDDKSENLPSAADE